MTGVWPIRDFTVQLDTTGLVASDIAAIDGPLNRVFAAWSGVCGVSFRPPADPAWSPTNLVIRFVTDLRSDPTVANADAQAGAWLNGYELGLTDEPLNVGPDSTLVMRLNTSPVGGYTDEKLYQVILHELGHFLGLDHCDTDEPSCMSATLDERVTAPQPWEIVQVQTAYGPPRSE